MNADELTMRDLCGEDVFTAAKIISKTDLSKLKNASSETDGKAVWLDMVHTVCGALDTCRNDIIGFLASLYCVKEEDIKAMKPAELVYLIKKTLQSEGFCDFFTAVSESLSWA